MSVNMDDHSLLPQIIVLRDSLGTLAVQVLAARNDLSKMSSFDMIQELYSIIDELHTEYDRSRTNLHI